ncbi:hypothetical protein IMZ29_11310 [Achromobacter sp. GG226]|uniref:hypothetical protein n=1 Tax=Verticiella alkaliphila TaxID=2779529 RepID=UPI001C0D80E0|nr:hypothetical protein [Verticiella sp. GG226]MBU4611098.1 hypothetical protein [Verticiella sp. GG226]
MPPIETQQVLTLQTLLQDPALRAELAQQTTLESLVDCLCHAAEAHGTPLGRSDVLNALTAAGAPASINAAGQGPLDDDALSAVAGGTMPAHAGSGLFDILSSVASKAVPYLRGSLNNVP